MQGLVFIYDEKRSARNQMFTVRIEARKKTGALWVPAGPTRYYTARDLQKPGVRFIDSELFSLAFTSETDIRKQEGRFYSADEDYSIYRISPYDLKAFLDRCFCTEILCRPDGHPIHFDYLEHIVPQVAFTRAKDGYTTTISMGGRKVDGTGVVMAANPVRFLSETRVYELVRGLPVNLIRDLLRERIISHEAYERLLKALSPYAGKIDLRSAANHRKKVVRQAAVTPVLDINRSLQFANLGFQYDGFELIAMEDKRKVFFNPKTNIELHRNFKKEGAWRRRLEKRGALHRASSQGEWFIPEGKRERLLHQLKTEGFVLQLAGAPLMLDVTVAWEIAVKDQTLIVGGAVRNGDLQTDLENLLDAYLSHQAWFDLPGGSRGYISKNLSDELAQLERRGDFRDEEIMFEPYDFSFVAEVFRDHPHVFQDPSFRAYLTFLQAMADPDRQTACPTALQAELRPYQRVGFSWLAGLQQFGFGGVLADDMGLGKTLQVLALLLHQKENSAQRHLTLLILPKTLIWNWAAEIEKFAPTLRTKLHIGPGRDKALEDLSGVDLVVTSYGLVRQDIDLLRQVTWDLLVLDEAQAIKNPEAMVSQAVRNLNASNRLVLTGTPIENRPLDLWSLFDFLMPGFLGEKATFKKTYEQQGRASLTSLGTLTAPFILRRMKKEVCAELPQKTEVTLYCDFSPAQRTVYDEILKTGRERLSTPSDAESASGSRTMQVLTLLLRLRQAACHPALVSADPSENGTHHIDAFNASLSSSGKLETLLETAREILAGGYKILVFSQFVAHLELVRKSFAREGIEQHTLYGTTTQRKRVIERFKSSQTPCVFLISLKTGGVGLNLTEAGYVFLLDPWWNPATENQAIDRSYRIGQKNPVTVYRFITKNSVEESVNRLKAQKKQIEKAVLAPGAGQELQLSEQALLALIE